MGITLQTTERRRGPPALAGKSTHVTKTGSRAAPRPPRAASAHSLVHPHSQGPHTV